MSLNSVLSSSPEIKFLGVWKSLSKSMPGSLAARLLLGREKPWERGCVRGRKVWKVVHWRFISTGVLLGENKDLLCASSMHQWKFLNSRSWSENTISANRKKRSLYFFGVLNQLTQSWWVMSLVKTRWRESMNKPFQREVFIDSMRIEGAELKFCLCS